ncbi:MAG: TolC family protein [Campylobacteraceae bacterium]|nr:TolC family protein [Campylobacteraceae bacterium]
MNKMIFCICVSLFFTTQSFSQTVYDFDTLSNALVNTSPKLKQDEINIMIAKENIDIANSGYYPTLRLAANMERSRKFENLYVPSYIGDDSLTQSDGKYISTSLYLSYELYRFGATDYSITAAKENANVMNAAKCIREKENILSLLESYSKVRIQNYRLNEYKKIQELYVELYSLTKRLYESGRVAKTNSMEYAEKLADAITTIAGVKEERAGYLSYVVYLSGIDIKENDILEPLNKNIIDMDYKDVPFENSVTAKKIMAVIAQKQTELSLRKTNYLPAISFYIRYDLYGSSIDSYNEALNDFKGNGYRLGISFSMPLFDGFKSDSDMNIKKFELMQSRFEYEDAKRVYEREQFMINSQIELGQNRLDSIWQSANSSQELTQADTSLYEAGELDRVTLLNDMINQIKINIAQNEALELLAMNIKKREISNQKESQCAAH